MSLAADQPIVKLLLKLMLTLDLVNCDMRCSRDKLQKMAVEVTLLHIPFLGCGGLDSLSKDVP